MRQNQNLWQQGNWGKCKTLGMLSWSAGAAYQPDIKLVNTFTADVSLPGVGVTKAYSLISPKLNFRSC